MRRLVPGGGKGGDAKRLSRKVEETEDEEQEEDEIQKMLLSPGKLNSSFRLHPLSISATPPLQRVSRSEHALSAKIKGRKSLGSWWVSLSEPKDPQLHLHLPIHEKPGFIL